MAKLGGLQHRSDTHDLPAERRNGDGHDQARSERARHHLHDGHRRFPRHLRIGAGPNYDRMPVDPRVGRYPPRTRRCANLDRSDDASALSISTERERLDASIAAADEHAAAAATAFPEPQDLRSRDIFRLVPRVWPFIKPYKKHLIYLLLSVIPGLPGGLFALALLGVFFDVVGNGKALNPFQAWMLQVPMTAGRHEILWHACVFSGIMLLISIPYGIALLAYGIWILQRMTNQFRVDLYTRLQELSLR